MKIEKTPKTLFDYRQNSFGQLVRSYDDVEYVTVTGSLSELMEYSHSNPVYVRRAPQTEHLFPGWDDGKFAVLYMGKVSCTADTLREINGANWYTHKGIIEEV